MVHGESHLIHGMACRGLHIELACSCWNVNVKC